MKWETRYARLNLIIGLIFFSIRKKGQLGKKILFKILQVKKYYFLQFQTSHVDPRVLTVLNPTSLYCLSEFLSLKKRKKMS